MMQVNLLPCAATSSRCWAAWGLPRTANSSCRKGLDFLVQNNHETAGASALTLAGFNLVTFSCGLQYGL